MKHARIYKPGKSVMQSGKAANKKWRLQIISNSATFNEPIMGWTGAQDMSSSELNLTFMSLEAAISYAKANGYEYEVIEPKQPIPKLQAYSDNFKSSNEC